MHELNANVQESLLRVVRNHLLKLCFESISLMSNSSFLFNISQGFKTVELTEI